MWMNLKNTLLNGESSAQWSIYSLIPVTDTFWNLKLIYDKKNIRTVLAYGWGRN